MLPTGLLALLAPLLAFPTTTILMVEAQFTYPPPLDRPLTDYTSGAARSALNFSDGDNMFGGWTTPGRLQSFLLYRCVHTPSSRPLYPSNSSFWDQQGRASRSGDGTWEQMPLHSSGAFGSGLDPGRNPIWLHGDFFAPNATTGNLCWFELLPGQEVLEYLPEGRDGYVRNATVDGSGSDFYFATVPFEVRPRRPSGLTVTWKGGTPRPDIFSNSTKNLDLFAQEFPDYAKSSSSSSSKKSAAADGIGPSNAVLLLWIVGFALMAVVTD